jgi:hypothetical protein
MSTYLGRVIEVRIPKADTGFQTLAQVPSEAGTYQYWENGRTKYVTIDKDGNKTFSDTCEYIWKLVEATDEWGSLQSKYYDGPTAMRDKYFDNYWDPFEIAKNGIPDDVDPKTLEIIKQDYHYQNTYCTLKDLHEIYSKEFTKFKNKLKCSLYDKKLDLIMEKLDIPIHQEENDEDPFELCFEFDYSDVRDLDNEISSIYRFTQRFRQYSYISPENIRIHYWLE